MSQAKKLPIKRDLFFAYTEPFASPLNKIFRWVFDFNENVRMFVIIKNLKAINYDRPFNHLYGVATAQSGYCR